MFFAMLVMMAGNLDTAFSTFFRSVLSESPSNNSFQCFSRARGSLPKKNGFDVLETLKKSTETKGIPVIVLTMLGSDEDIKKGIRLGANDYIVKSQHAVAEITERVKGFFAKESHPEGAQPVR